MKKELDLGVMVFGPFGEDVMACQASEEGSLGSLSGLESEWEVVEQEEQEQEIGRAHV